MRRARLLVTALLLPLAGAAHAGPAGGSLQALSSLRSELAAQPDAPGKDAVLGVLEELVEGAAREPSDLRDGWVDAHLGTLNQTVLSLPDSFMARRAARAAARLNSRAERWEDARALADRALRADPNDEASLVSRARAHAGLSDFAAAYADAEKAARLSPSSSEAHTARAAAAYGLGNYLQAAEDARRALALDPEDRVAFALMKLSEGRSRRVGGFDTPEGARLADSVEREYHGMVQQQNQAEERLRAPVERPAPAAAGRLASSAGAKISVKDYWGAVDDADKALSLDPGNARAMYFRSVAHNLIGEYGEAARDATRGLVVLPSDPALHDARAWAYNRMGRFHDAAADANRALEADPRDAYAYANRGYAAERRGDLPAMLADYKAAAALNPQFEPAYLDAARRHGLAAEASGAAPPAPAAPARRWRSFAAVAASSLAGGLLIAFGALRAGGLLSRRRSGGIEGSYAIGQPIGQGGMGIVYAAVDRRLKRPVAIKMLRDDLALDPAAKAGFLEEARTVAELRHPAIVTLHGVLEDGRGLYLIFERLEGSTLDQVLEQRGRLPPAQALDVLGPVCDALEYAHRRGVVHRDLKPANVMLTPGGVKVLDFGIARHAARARRSARTETVVGTPHYMAPEQERGFIRPQNDVFALGVLLYEALTGARPYDGAAPAKAAKSYRRASARAAGLSLEIDALIDRALEPDPERRTASPAEFKRQLAAAVQSLLGHGSGSLAA